MSDLYNKFFVFSNSEYMSPSSKKCSYLRICVSLNIITCWIATVTLEYFDHILRSFVLRNSKALILEL